MTDLALSMLLERLLWPVPRVRWEVSRSLALLIREGNDDAAQSLLDWIGTRQLESEVVLGLCIIEAFNLGSFFEFADVSKAVQVPSLLSDWILKNNFKDAHGLSVFRYGVSDSAPAKLKPEVEFWFEKYRKWAVPLLFSFRLQKLEESTGFRFFEYWKHEWRWLQAIHARPSADSPLYFARGDRRREGQFDHGQRELYVSAYLRTLAYATHVGAISRASAEMLSLICLTMNRGLADLQPVQRPEWSQNLLAQNHDNFQEVARDLWQNAISASNSDEVPIHLRVLDTNASGFIEYELNMSLVPSGYTSLSPELNQLDGLIVVENPSRLIGPVDQISEVNASSITSPLTLSQMVEMKNFGRAHIELCTNIRLASPILFGIPAQIKCNQSEIILETNDHVFSRWIHWHTNWEPTAFSKLNYAIGSMTTISKSSLEKLQNLLGVTIRPIGKITRTIDSDMYDPEHKVCTDTFWV